MKNLILSFVVSLLPVFNAFSQPQRAVDTTYLSSVKTELQKERPENRNINLVFHGHSGPAGFGNNHEVHTLEAYPNLVLKKLKAIYPLAVINIIVTAIGGENAISGAARFESEVLTHKPDVIVIDYTGNDIGAGLEKSKKAWEKMIEMALKNSVKVILVTPGVDRRIDINGPDNPYQQHALQVRTLATKYNVGIADPFLIFQKLIKQPGFITSYMASINHFNEKGHEIYAAEIFEWFKK